MSYEYFKAGMPDGFYDQIGYLMFAEPDHIDRYRDEVIDAAPFRYSIWHRHSPAFLEEIVELARRLGFRQACVDAHSDNYAGSPWFTDSADAVAAYIDEANKLDFLIDWVLTDRETGTSIDRFTNVVITDIATDTGQLTRQWLVKDADVTTRHTIEPAIVDERNAVHYVIDNPLGDPSDFSQFGPLVRSHTVVDRNCIPTIYPDIFDGIFAMLHR